MNQADIEALAKGMAPVVRDTIAKSLGPIINRLVALESREPEKGEPGKPGDNGKDGFSLDDFDVNVADDGRTIVMSFDQGQNRFEAEMKFPVPIYRNVFKEGEEYEPGDMVTWGGSVWHCGEKTTAKPDSPDSGWRLAVKKGRDAKDAK